MFPRRELRTPFTDDGFEGFYKLHTLDPVTFSALELQEWYRALSYLVANARDASPEIVRNTKAMLAVRDFTEAAFDRAWDINVVHSRPPAELLQETLARRETLVENFTVLRSLFLQAAGLLELAPDVYEPKLAVIDSEFEALQRRCALVTPAHLALQNHLEHLLYLGKPSPPRTEGIPFAADLYQPLTELRNEFFDSPKADLLSAYLKLAASIKSGDEYRWLYEFNLSTWPLAVSSSPFAKAEARLPDLEAEVEVFALMEDYTVSNS